MFSFSSLSIYRTVVLKYLSSKSTLFLRKLFLEIYVVPLNGVCFPVSLHALCSFVENWIFEKKKMAALLDWHGRALLLSKSLIPDISTGLKLKNFSGLCWMCVLSGPVCMCSLSPCHFPWLLLNVLISQSVSFQFLLRA